MTASSVSEAKGRTNPVTHGRVLRIALPILLANITVPLIGAVDTAVVGQIPRAEPIAAVGLGAVVLSAIYWVFGFLRMGTTGLVAQAIGEGDKDEVAALLTRALLIACTAGAVLVLFQSLIFAGVFRFVPSGPEVESLARDYLQIRIWTAPAAIAFFGVNGWLIAQERARSVLLLQLWMNGINVGLDLLFVLGLGWGVEGVALATVIAEVSGLAFGLWLCRGVFANAAWRAWSRVLNKARLKRLGMVNSDILIRSLLLESVMVSFLYFGAKQGDLVLASNQVLMQFLHISSYALDGFAFAAEALVGQAVGAGAVSQLRRSARVSSLWGVGFALVLATAFALGGPTIIALITKAPEVQAEAARYLPWLVLAPLMALASFMLDGIFIGATRTRDMRNMMAVAAACYFAMVVLTFDAFGNHALWISLNLCFAVRALTLALRYPALERSVRVAS